MDNDFLNFAKAEMLIRNPIEVVFEAFVNPEVTTRFWFTKSTGRLDEKTHVKWTWDMYGFTIPVEVKSIEPNKKIIAEWGEKDKSTLITWDFKDLNEAGTFVSITNSGFKGNTDEIVSLIRASTEGFAFVLAALKALLEHGIHLNLIRDRFPEGLQ